MFLFALWLFFLVWFVWALWRNFLKLVYKLFRIFGYEIDPEQIETLRAIAAIEKGTNKLIKERRMERQDGFVVTKEEMDWWDKLGYRPK